jgi:hypothetical protein
LTPQRDDVPRGSVLALNAYLLTSIGASVGAHEVLSLGVPCVCAGFLTAIAAARSLSRRGARTSLDWPFAWLIAMTTVALLSGPRDEPARWYQVFYRIVPIAGVLLVGAAQVANARGRRIAVGVTVLLACALQLLTPAALPRPLIDVWSWTVFSTRALLAGVHPYTVHAPDIYRGAFDMGYTSTIYPYMPLTLLVHAPFVALTGDYRLDLALCLPASILLMRAAGRRAAVDARLLDTLTLALALHPRGAYLVASGYNEPLLMVAAAAFVYFAVRRPYGAPAVASFLLLPALKQYVVAPALMLVTDLVAHRRFRPLVIGAAMAAATVAPFLVWNPHATLSGIVFQVGPSIAFRPDSTSLTALANRLTGITPWHWMPEALQLAVGAVAYARLRAYGTGGLLLASALSLFASFLFGTQAFVNYYHFVGVLLLFSALLFARQDHVIA